MSEKRATGPMIFDVTGMDCGDCARSVERAVSQLPSVNTAAVSLGAGTLTVTPGDTAIEDLARTIERTVDRAGYSAMLRIDGQINRVQRAPWWKSRKIVPTAIAVALWIVAFGVQHLSGRWNLAVATYLAAIVIGGYPIARAALVSLRARRVDMNVLMTISVIGASLIGEWSEGALVVVLFTVGTTMQALTLERTRSALRSLFDLAPDEATVLRDGVEMEVRASTLVPGDLVRVRPGERVPADAEIVAGMSTLNESAITGESLPVEKGEGQQVFAGSLNGSGTLTLRVTALSSESTLAKIIHLVEEAQSSKAPSQQMIDRFASLYTPAVVVLAAVIAAGGWLVLNDGQTWFYRALVLLVIACPCALVISTPVSIVSAIGAATKQGMLVKGGAALEEAGRTRLIAFDKTGTLTLGRPTVTRVIVPGSSPVQRDETELLSLAAAVEHDSEHPLARAVIAKALHDRVPELTASDFVSYAGRGASATVDGREIALGNARLMTELGVPASEVSAVDAVADRDLAVAGETGLMIGERLAGGWHIVGLIAVADRIRPGAKAALENLREQGVERLVMLTGDRQGVADVVAKAVGVDEVHAGLLPHEKAEIVKQLQRDGWHVTLLGDGVNDAPALTTADVGIAMGMGGTDVALDSADLALMRDDLSVVGSVIDLSKRTLAIIRQNITLSMVTKAAALLLGVLGFVNLWIAVLADVGTSMVVTLNGLRLARVQALSVPVSEEAAEACGCGEDHDHAHDHGHDHAHDHAHEAVSAD